ncbi:MAG: AEC family transporter [Synechococcaceae cyanobacterium SM2_3_2]|nr:AEC family transporter [Synechococcaceae cyanobacterium SM2_3_2]
MLNTLLQVYAPLVGWTVVGIVIRRLTVGIPWADPRILGRLMYWLGVPLGIIGFLLGTDLSGSEWVAGLMGWVAVAIAAALSWIFWRVRGEQRLTAGQWGSFQLSAMLGNTGYVGFPLCLAVGGMAYFGWALFYDMLCTLFSAYGLGVWVASRSGKHQLSQRQVAVNVLRSPALWSFGFGLLLKGIPVPDLLQESLLRVAWGLIPVSLIMLGMRLGMVDPGHRWFQAGWPIMIKLILVPALVAMLLIPLPIPVMAKLIITLQAGMPPAMATLVLTEEFELDYELTIGSLALGYGLSLLTLPLWILLWGGG